MAWTVSFLVLLYLLDLIAAQQAMLITELPAYSKLDSCPMSVVSSAGVMFSVQWCPGVNVATSLASCICLEYVNSFIVSAGISNGIIVTYFTGTTGASLSGEVSAALDVLTSYCQPAENAATATSTTESSTYSPGSVSMAPTSTGVPTTTNSPEKPPSSFSPSSEDIPGLSSSSMSSTTISTPSMTTSISPSTSTSISSPPLSNPQNSNHSPSAPLSHTYTVIITLCSATVAIIVLFIIYRCRKPSKTPMARSSAIELSRIQIEPDSNNPQSTNSGPPSDSNAYNNTIGGGS